MGEPPAQWRPTWIGWLPVPALILTSDGTAVAANDAWAALSPVSADGEGWLQAVGPALRPALMASLRLAAAAAESGTADCRVAGTAGGRWSRWWWRPAPQQHLVVCAAVIDEGQPASFGLGHNGDSPAALAAWSTPGPQAGSELAEAVIHRIFRAGLMLASAASLLDGSAAAGTLRAVAELDELVRDIRRAALQP